MTIQKTVQKFENVQNMRINGKKYSTCELYYYSKESNAWIYDGKLCCQGWYKKGETIFKKCQDELNG